uniref:Uncharacterized protein n=1 Tax=Rhizophora mucronata TaxID=61149 RepID=A0A2P2IQ74_RHIMU
MRRFSTFWLTSESFAYQICWSRRETFVQSKLRVESLGAGGEFQRDRIDLIIASIIGSELVKRLVSSSGQFIHWIMRSLRNFPSVAPNSTSSFHPAQVI